MAAPTSTVSPTKRLTGHLPPSTLGEICSMTSRGKLEMPMCPRFVGRGHGSVKNGGCCRPFSLTQDAPGTGCEQRQAPCDQRPLAARIGVGVECRGGAPCEFERFRGASGGRVVTQELLSRGLVHG